MEPKLKVFLSSAQFEDEFIVEREGLPAVFVKQPLASAFILWRIEDYSSPDNIESHYLKQVNDSDIMILLIGKQYRSAVESEYRQAISNSIPIFAFIKNCDEKRDAEQKRLIVEVRERVTTTAYTGLEDLVNKIENSILQHYLRDSQKQNILRWRTEHEKRKLASQEERSLRLLAGILATDEASSTRSRVVEILLKEAVSICPNRKPEEVVDIALRIIHSENMATRTELLAGLKSMVKCGVFENTPDGLIGLGKPTRSTSSGTRAEIADAENRLISRLYKQHSKSLNNITLRDFRIVLTSAISQVLYDSAVDMAEQEFGSGSNPFPYDADELNRIVASALLSVPDFSSGSLSTWQPIIVAVLRSDIPEVIAWLNRLRKAYWVLTVLGMDPQAVEYTGDHLRNYCVYFDSHIVLRALVEAGGEAELCRKIVFIGKELGVEMRLSQPLFQETSHAISAANKVYYAAGQDVVRAISFLEKIHRKSDIYDGFMAAKSRNFNLSWDNYINRFYSPADETKLQDYLKNELGITVQPERDFSVEQLGQIEEMTEQLLKKRRKMIQPPANLDQENLVRWERQYLLRTNEARQMAIIYNLRQESDTQFKQYWFITFDEFVYEVSTAMVSRDNRYFEFPCYMKPATWLQILSNGSSSLLPINTFREILLSKDVQQLADQLEAEVITQMLQSRVDQEVKSIETLRHMFADIVNRPAVQEAYQQVLKSDGLKKLAAADSVKAKIIEEMKDKVNELERLLARKADETEVERRRYNKAEGKANYLKRQLRALTSGKRNIGKKRR